MTTLNEIQEKASAVIPKETPTGIPKGTLAGIPELIPGKKSWTNPSTWFFKSCNLRFAVFFKERRK